MTREEFEEWLQENGDEALDRIDPTTLPLTRWVLLYSKALKYVATEYGPPPADDDAVDDDPLDFPDDNEV